MSQQLLSSARFFVHTPGTSRDPRHASKED
jgi:hypothetical protein